MTHEAPYDCKRWTFFVIKIVRWHEMNVTRGEFRNQIVNRIVGCTSPDFVLNPGSNPWVSRSGILSGHPRARIAR